MADQQNVVLPKKGLLKKVRMTDPGYMPNKDQGIPDIDTSYLNKSIKQLRSLQPVKVIRALGRFNGVVSTALFAYVQTALTTAKVKAYHSNTHQFDKQGTQLAKSILSSMETLYDYTEGYADRDPMETVVETALKETVLTGACAGELVLNKARFPDRIVFIPAEDLRWKAKGGGSKGKYPFQLGQQGEIPLNIPTFWVQKSQQMANQVFPRSMFEAALNTAFTYLEFIEDMHRVVRRNGHSRLVVKLDQEKITQSAPPDIASDANKMQQYLTNVKTDVEDAMAGLDPDDALVCYDTASFDTLSKKGEKTDYTPLLEALSGLMATSLKSHPSILGLRIEGSQSLSNTESMVFLKMARAIQTPVAAFISRALTLGARLVGADVYVRYQFDPIDLRPETELESFRAMHQARVLEQLSYGFISDEDAAEQLGTGERPPSAPKLSGTFFYKNNNANADQVSPNTGPQERALQPDTPSKESN